MLDYIFNLNSDVKKNIRGILFLINASFILLSETLGYTVTHDYSLFIDRLTKRLASINILYVKIFQAFALNNSLIDDKTNNKLLSFTDNAPWDYSDVELASLVKIADKYDLQLKNGYEIPINSGMISLVFKVYNKFGEPVIVKMKRKNIKEKLDIAINNLLFFMYILSFIPVFNKYKLADIVNKNIEIIKHQTNFLEEIDNMDKIREKCKNLKYVKIPKANRQITEEFHDVIVMDYIDGMKINQVNECDHEPFVKLIMKFGIVSSVIHGVTHGDLHSGNILFIKDEKDKKYPHKIGLIDFGIIYEVGTEYKDLLFDVFTQMFEIDPRECAEKILNSGIVEPKGIFKQIPKKDYNNIVTFLEEILRETISNSNKANQLQIYRFLRKLNDYLSSKELMNVGIRPSDDFIKSQLVVAMAHGITLLLCKNDFMPLMDKVINELFHTELLLS